MWVWTPARVDDEDAQGLVSDNGREDAARGVVDTHGIVLGDRDDADGGGGVGQGAGGSDLLVVAEARG